MPQHIRDPSNDKDVIAARNIEHDWKQPDHVRRKAAQTLIDLVMGGGKKSSAPKTLLDVLMGRGEGHNAKIAEGTSPRVSMVMSYLNDMHPKVATDRIFELPDKDHPDYGPIRGINGWAGIGIKDRENGNLIPQNEMIGTGLHELAHSAGLPDGFFASSDPTPEQLKRPVVASDISMASGRLRSDVNLPLSGSDSLQKVLLGKGRKLQHRKERP
jgi:hypothetical protein